MKGSGLLTLYLLGPILCGAQDVFIAPGFEHASFSGDGYVDGAGACLGLRFPIGGTRSTVEVRPAYVSGTAIIESLAVQRRDQRVGGSIGFLRTHELKENFALEFGAETGFYVRWVDSYHANYLVSVEQRSAILGGTIGLKLSTLRSVHPFLALHPFYEQELSAKQFSPRESMKITTGSQFGLSLCLGLIIGLQAEDVPPEKEMSW